MKLNECAKNKSVRKSDSSMRPNAALQHQLPVACDYCGNEEPRCDENWATGGFSFPRDARGHSVKHSD